MAEMPRFDRVMSDAEGLMWRLEKDPHLASTFANITILDRPPDQPPADDPAGGGDVVAVVEEVEAAGTGEANVAHL